MGMAHMGDQLLVADAGFFQNLFADLQLLGVVEPPAQIDADQIQVQLRIAAIREEMVAETVPVNAVSHPDSIYAGASGAALWGAYRHGTLTALQELAAA